MAEKPSSQGSCVLAVDQGTTNTKAMLVAADGTIRSRASAPVSVSTPAVGHVEQDPEELWRSVVTAMTACLDGQARPIGVAISNQRESVVAWDAASGRAHGPVLGWQDSRTAGWCAQPDVVAASDLVRRRTGLPLDPMFSAPKLRWLLDHDEHETPRSTLRLGTIDAWLISRLTGGAHVCDAGNASRTLLFDLDSGDWHPELLNVFGLDAELLPTVMPSAVLGSATPPPTGLVTRGVPGVPDGLPILAVLADSHAALFGQGCTEPGQAKATYGTGSSVMAPTPVSAERPADVPITLAWTVRDVAGDHPARAREGNIVSSGAALAWTARLLGLADVATLARLASAVPDAGGVILVPALAGLGAPHWDRSARAITTGMTTTTEPAHLARAAFDALAHQICDVVEAIDAAAAVPIHSLRADGGATVSDLLMQRQADLLARPVSVAAEAELSAFGAARLAWRALGTEVPAAVTAREFQPEPTVDAAEQRAAWRAAVRTARAAVG